MKKYYLGIDTSNYTTSVAAVGGDGKIIFDRRQVLHVKEGERGLRQSQALFEHICNLPDIISGLNEVVKAGGYELGGVGVSTRPRPVEGSYMPCFRAGEAAAKAVAETAGVRLVETSHQEGHLAAALKTDSVAAEVQSGRPVAALETDCTSSEPDLLSDGDFIAFHLSGGTTEALLCSRCKDGGFEIEIIGGTGDISFGQLIDRVGVSLGIGFPCGSEVDRLALQAGDIAGRLLNPFCKIKTEDCFLNISGIETQVQRYIKGAEEKDEDPDKSLIAAWLLDRVGEALEKAVEQARKKTGIDKTVLMGGVSSSEYIRKHIKKDDNLIFGKPELCSDNAVGVALICAEACEGESVGQ